MIVFAATVPHSPLLVPSIGKEHREKLAATISAYAELEQALYLAKPDTIALISPHAHMYPDAFCGNIADTFSAGLQEFGDHGTTISAKPDFFLMDRLHRAARNEHIPFTLTSEPTLDYGFTVPLLYLVNHLLHWKLLPIAPSYLDGASHVEFGRLLKRVFHAEQKRVAIIASVDLSHHASDEAPKGKTKEGIQFDATAREALRLHDPSKLLALPTDVVNAAQQCAINPLLILLGSLDHLNVKTQELIYEAPFGVGSLCVRFDIA